MKHRLEDKKMKRSSAISLIRRTIGSNRPLFISLLFIIAGSVAAALIPPLILEQIVNRLAGKKEISLKVTGLYFGMIVISGLFDAIKEVMITIFGQQVTGSIRHEMCSRLSHLPASYFIHHDPGVTVSRFTNDVDTLESMFASGLVGMGADICKVVSILMIIQVKSKGLSILLFLTIPLLFVFTRCIQKRMYAAQKQKREAVGKVAAQVPETIHNIRMIHVFHIEKFMKEHYKKHITQSYDAMEKSNFYDAIYSPVIILLRAFILAIMMVLASSQGEMQNLFGMSVGTAVAVIAYVSRIFAPIESIGMEIQSIQSAIAGIHRIREFLEEKEKVPQDSTIKVEELLESEALAVQFNAVSFGYEKNSTVFQNVSFQIRQGEHIVISGRTGAGKSTIFKLILGLYSPESGKVLVLGKEADKIPDAIKRKIFGYVEQNFHPVAGTIADQIRVYDRNITEEQVKAAAQLAGIHDVICQFKSGYDTIYEEQLFSQGQSQLLSIARAVAANPPILLLDEITANLDVNTEETVLHALKQASRKRTVITISHRLYETIKEEASVREIHIG